MRDDLSLTVLLVDAVFWPRSGRSHDVLRFVWWSRHVGDPTGTRERLTHG